MSTYDWVNALSNLGSYLRATALTLEISVLAFALANVLGLIAAAGRLSRLRVVRTVAGVYVEVIRNTPVLLQVFVAYFALPSVGLHLSSFTAGVVALGVNVGAYLAEVFRAGIRSVPAGQREAAQVLALSRLQTFWHVVLPQAFRNVYPAFVNLFIQILLGSSLLSAISVPELTGTATVINSTTLLSVQVFTIALVIYLILSNGISLLATLVGARVFRPALPVGRHGTMWPLTVRLRRLIGMSAR
jgi:polar amino acid transport system permease protein